MSDRLHDHIELGFRPGCVACAQLEADLAICARQAPKAYSLRGLRNTTLHTSKVSG